MLNPLPAVLRRLAGRCLLLALLGGSGAASAGAQDAMSLEEIKSQLKQQQAKLQSLFVECEEEWKSPLSLADLHKLRGFEYKLRIGKKERSAFAFKGEKRYRHVVTVDPGDEELTLQPLPADATPSERDLHARMAKLLEQMGKRRALSWSGSRKALGPEFQRFTTVACNGRTLWQRDNMALARARDGNTKSLPTVQTHDAGLAPRMVIPTRYFLNLGLAIVPPLGGQSVIGAGDLPEILERHAYSVSKNLEEVDGAKCLVLTATYENKVSFGTESEVFRIIDKLWLDPQRGLALRKRETRHGEGKPFSRVVNSNFEQVAPGLWFAKETEDQEILPSEGGQYPEQYRGRPVILRHVKVVRWVINQVPDDLFDPLVKPGDQVVDQRGIAPPVER